MVYQSRSGCCIAEDQIVFKVPNNVGTGCAVPLVVQIGTAPTRSATTNPALASIDVEPAVMAGPVTYGTINVDRI